jgi:hypothetical protein
MIAGHFLLLPGVFNDCRAFFIDAWAFLMMAGHF